MKQPTSSEPLPTPERKQGSIAEVALAFAIMLILTVGLDLLARVNGLIASNLLLLVGAVFVITPMVMLRRRARSDLEYGLAFDDWRRGLAVGSIAFALICIAYPPLHYGWKTQVEDAALLPALDNLRAPPDAFFGEPATFPDTAPQIFTRGNRTIVAWQTPDAPWGLELRSESGVATSFSALQRLEPPSRRVLSGREQRNLVVAFYPTGAAPLEVEANVEGEPIALEAYRLGAAERSPSARFQAQTHIQVPQNFWWLLSLLASQLILVALPEEFFYRGYLQERLSEAIGRKRFQFGPLFVTWPIVITSGLFALGHVAIGLDPARAAVFFPSLAFGYLRERTGGITAPIVFHAGCNMLMYLLEAHYFYV